MEVQVSEPWVAEPLRGNVRMTAIGGGVLLVPDLGTSYRSDDAGHTWMGAPEAGPVCPRRDGTVVSLIRHRVPGTRRGRLEPEGDPPWRRFHLDLGVSTDGWRTVERMPTVIETPPITPTASDAGSIDNPPGIGNVLELEDGRLVASIDGNFASDSGEMPGLREEFGFPGFRPYRVFLVASDDGGRTWNFAASIAHDGVTGQESFCEEALADLGNGELLAAMRTGRYAPLHFARSLDGGRSWGAPTAARVLSLKPGLTLLPNGVLLCAYGWRPYKSNQIYKAALADYHKRYEEAIGIAVPEGGEAGNYVMASRDGGQTWQAHIKIAEPVTTGYSSIVAIGHDRALAAVRRCPWPDEDTSSDWTTGDHVELREITVAVPATTER
ncbi:MAG: hypothetical protein CL878_01170 [Dehalococcoidia bacterium]|nr:hypothetical protein [Dehalococcoidia bacterium]